MGLRRGDCSCWHSHGQTSRGQLLPLSFPCLPHASNQPAGSVLFQWSSHLLGFLYHPARIQGYEADVMVVMLCNELSVVTLLGQ